MTADTDPRTKFVEWSESRNALVFRNTTAPVAELWEQLRQGRTLKEILSQRHSVPTPLVLGVLRSAGKLLTHWPDTAEEQVAAHAHAIESGDIRFASGTVNFLPGVRGGLLLCGDTGVRAEIVWSYLTGGATFGDINYQYDVPSSMVVKMIDTAEVLFSKGLVRGANLPR